RLQGLLQQVFGLFNRHVDASGDEALAHEPFFVDNGVSANEDCVSIFDVFGGEVTFHADRTAGFNLQALPRVLGGCLYALSRHVSVGDTSGACWDREDERFIRHTTIKALKRPCPRWLRTKQWRP